MEVAVGHSDEIETSDAIADAIKKCEATLTGPPKAAMLFASVEYDHEEALAAVHERWPSVQLIGGSTDGELSAEGGFSHDSLVLTLFGGDGIGAYAGLGTSLSGGIDEAVAVATAGAPTEAPAACFTIFAPSTNASEVVRSLATRFPEGTPILGGLTGDHREFARMREFHGKTSHADALTVLLLYGDVKISWGVGSGWFPIGKYHTVTSSQGHLVRSIENEPAIEAYRSYWGSLPAGSLGEYPIAVYPDGPDGDWCLRAAMECDEDDGSLRFAGEVPDGASIRLTEVLPEGILSGTQESIRVAFDRYPGETPRLALAFSCAARKWVLGGKAEQEVELLAGVFGEREVLPLLAGCYCFGEIAPIGEATSPGFHNETCVTVLVGQ